MSTCLIQDGIQHWCVYKVKHFRADEGHVQLFTNTAFSPPIFYVSARAFENGNTTYGREGAVEPGPSGLPWQCIHNRILVWGIKKASANYF